MIVLSIVIAILALFYALGKSADIVIANIKAIGERLGIKIFFLGILLGLFTSLPELALGITAVVNDVVPISVGNLLGGLIVMFSLVLGLSAIVNRTIVTGEKASQIIFVFAFFLVPCLFALNGIIGSLEGLLIAALYLLMLLGFYFWQRGNKQSDRLVLARGNVIKNMFLLILGIVLVVVISNLIIRLTETLLSFWQVKPFIVGILLFALGTNLPEITVMLRSWRRNIKDLLLSSLIGSGMANILILGILALIQPIVFSVRPSFYVFLACLILLCVVVSYVIISQRKLTRKEGILLVSIYFLFVISQVSILIFNPS